MAKFIEKKSNTRLIIATSLFFTSVLASFLISYVSHQSRSYWVLTQPIAKGVQISAADIELQKADLAQAMGGYLTTAANPIGSITRRAMTAGELINRFAISEDSDELTSESISLAVRNSDLPARTSPGDLVALYQVQDSRNGEVTPAPLRIQSGVFIREISRKGSNFGSEVSLTISLHRDDVAKVLAATTSGRIVVVSSRG
jgi:hypothetical protein